MRGERAKGQRRVPNMTENPPVDRGCHTRPSKLLDLVESTIILIRNNGSGLDASVYSRRTPNEGWFWLKPVRRRLSIGQH